MIRIALAAFLMFALSLASLAADEPAKPSISWEGFADARVGLTGSDSSVELSQIELSVTAEITPWLSLDATIAGDGADGVGLGAGYMTIKHESDDMSLSLLAGRFDVPLGLSSFWYGSPDNALPFGTMINDTMVEGWNNAGVMGQFEAGSFSVSLYLVDGSMESMTNNDSGRAAGARVGWKPVEGVSVGVSLASSRHDAVQTFSWLGADLEAEFGPLALAFEYLAKLPDDTWDKRTEGIMAQAKMSLESLIGFNLGVIVRGDIVSPEVGDTQRALTIGLSWAYEESLRLTAAVQLPKGGDTGLVLQAVTAF